MTIEEILALENNDEIVRQFKERITPLPNVAQLRADWEPQLHDVMNPEIRKKRRVMVEEAKIDAAGNPTPARYEEEDVNRLPLALEQDIVNTRTAFAVAIEPKMTYEPNNEDEKKLYGAILSVYNKNKLKYQNKKVVRAWYSETEVAEYWFTVKDTTFWKKVFAKIKTAFTGKVDVERRLKSVVWSPFRGDRLYPKFDSSDDLVAMSRQYDFKESRTKTVTYFQTVTAQEVRVWKLDGGSWQIVPEKSFKHHFSKMPILYMHRREPICAKIKPLRERLEKLMSNYADCIDYHFFPYLVLESAEVLGASGRSNNHQIKIENGGKVYYLTWEQTPENIRLEMDTLLSQCYTLTDTPRLSLDTLKGLGNIPSGRAFDFLFMGTRLATEDDAEVIGEFMQRRNNFIVSAIGDICTSLQAASHTIDIDVEIVPYTINDLTENISNAIKAYSGGVVSQRSAVILAGVSDNVDAELEQINTEKTSKDTNKDNGIEPKIIEEKDTKNPE